MSQGLSQELRDALDPLFGEIESINERIAEYDRRIEKIGKEIYPQIALLQQVKGDVYDYSPVLADRVAISTGKGLDYAVKRLWDVTKQPSTA